MSIYFFSKSSILGLVCLVGLTCATAQKRRTVLNENITVQPASAKKMQFGLQAGDTLVLFFEETNRKKFGEVEIHGVNGGTVLFEYNVKEIIEKKAGITQTGIYELGLKNKALDSRTIKLRIERIPNMPNDKFDTQVYIAQKADTTYTTVNEDYMISVDTTFLPIVPHQTIAIESVKGNNKGFFKVELPYGLQSWAYWVGVGYSTLEALAKADERSSKYQNLVADSSGSAALAGLVLEGKCEITQSQEADNVQYWFVKDEQDVQAFLGGQDFHFFDKGNSAMAYERKEIPNSGEFYICLLNDNEEELIEVHIRVAAVTFKEVWGVREIKKMSINKYEESYLKD
ncbi:MAG: hypothetical protein ACJA08_000384 [Cyclobacteriaceae bacterium]|jgi:hypothetical protein